MFCIPCSNSMSSWFLLSSHILITCSVVGACGGGGGGRSGDSPACLADRRRGVSSSPEWLHSPRLILYPFPNRAPIIMRNHSEKVGDVAKKAEKTRNFAKWWLVIIRIL